MPRLIIFKTCFLLSASSSEIKDVLFSKSRLETVINASIVFIDIFEKSIEFCKSLICSPTVKVVMITSDSLSPLSISPFSLVSSSIVLTSRTSRNISAMPLITKRVELSSVTKMGWTEFSATSFFSSVDSVSSTSIYFGAIKVLGEGSPISSLTTWFSGNIAKETNHTAATKIEVIDILTKWFFISGFIFI